MPLYCIDKTVTENGYEHEVHEFSPSKCKNLPSSDDRIHLGKFKHWKEAVNQAKLRLPAFTVKRCRKCCHRYPF